MTGSSSLCAASYIGRPDIIRYLIVHNADMDLVGNGNYTNLMVTAYRQHTHVVECFLDQLGYDSNEYA